MPWSSMKSSMPTKRIAIISSPALRLDMERKPLIPKPKVIPPDDDAVGLAKFAASREIRLLP